MIVDAWITTLGRELQEDWEYKNSPGYLEGLRVAWATLDCVKRKRGEEERRKEREGVGVGGGSRMEYQI